jgi:DNA-binding CsgD family transcriptional regulator
MTQGRNGRTERLEQIRKEFDVLLRDLLLHLSAKLKAEDLLTELTDGSEKLLSRVAIDEATFVVWSIPQSRSKQLSRRQEEVAALLLEDIPIKTIAQQLGISPRTVENHVERIYVKFKVASRLGLVRRMTLLS